LHQANPPLFPLITHIKNVTVAREVEPPAKGKIISLPQVGELHHRYLRAAQEELGIP
jgi:hypothetical protein